MEEGEPRHHLRPAFTFSAVLRHSLAAAVSQIRPISALLSVAISLLLLLDLHLQYFPTILSFLLYKATHHLLLLLLTLPFFASIVRTVAATTPSYRPLATTFLFTHFLLLLSNVSAIALTSLGGLLAGPGPAGLLFLAAVSAAYVAALTLVVVTWVPACVVAAAEGAGWTAALRRGRELLRGREGIGVVMFMAFWMGLNGLEMAYGEVVVEGRWLGMPGRLAVAGVAVIVMPAVLVLGAAATAVAYTLSTAGEEESYYIGEYLLVEGKKRRHSQEETEPEP